MAVSIRQEPGGVLPSSSPLARQECLVNAHYDAHGLIGNPNVLRWMLGREPTRFADFVNRELPAA
jgi:hypothetical protein